jgi:hypothetical protein
LAWKKDSSLETPQKPGDQVIEIAKSSNDSIKKMEGKP